MADLSTAVAVFVAACRSLHQSAEAIATAAANHLNLGPDDITWANAEHTARLACGLEAIAAEVAAFGRGGL